MSFGHRGIGREARGLERLAAMMGEESRTGVEDDEGQGNKDEDKGKVEDEVSIVSSTDSDDSRRGRGVNELRRSSD